MSYYKTNDRSHGKKKTSSTSATGFKISSKSGIAASKDYKKSYNPKRGTSSTNATGGFRSNRPAQSKVAIKKFDPSFFIKKVEEQTASDAYIANHTFSDFLIEAQIKENIIAKGYVTPTPIQDNVIPLILDGKDIIATANTGTGKTAAFLIPLVNNVVTKKTERVLIITPTRELAGQIKDELDAFGRNANISSVLCIGGLNINFQVNHLKRNPAFVIGTPGRLLDLEKNYALNFGNFTSIVLDEVDTMLDMGFINDIKYIIARLPKKRHSLFFSATLPKDKDIMDRFLHEPISVNVKTRQSSENVNQDIIKIGEQDKVDVLHDLLIKPQFNKVIVFARTKGNTERLSKKLKDRGFDVATIHGDKSQSQRKTALTLFKDDKVKILLATDVVARGIDIDDVSHVINFDLPQTHEDYIHRIGRTGRANKIGQAITFIE